jgi:gluconokinase
MVIVLMGVAGSGKTTVGMALAHRLGWPFHDGDDFHPAPNREKMRRGTPLDDADRRPWLEALRAAIVRCLSEHQNAVFACSALKRTYREMLRVDRRVKFVYLTGTEDLIAERLQRRHGHFFDPALLRSQFDALEEPQCAVAFDITPPPAAIVDSIIESLQIRRADQDGRTHGQ